MVIITMLQTEQLQTLQAIILFTNKFIDIILIYSDVRVQWLCNLA